VMMRVRSVGMRGVVVNIVSVCVCVCVCVCGAVYVAV